MPTYPKFSTVEQSVAIRMAVIMLNPTRHTLSYHEMHVLKTACLLASQSKFSNRYFPYPKIKCVKNRDLLVWGYYFEDKLLIGRLIPPLENEVEKRNFGGCYVSELNNETIKTIEFKALQAIRESYAISSNQLMEQVLKIDIDAL